MSEAKVQFKLHKNGYAVLWAGETVGFVAYWETSYNLRRRLVVREWRAYPPGASLREFSSFRRRRDAAAWLVAVAESGA